MTLNTHDIADNNMYDDPKRIWCEGFGKHKQQFVEGWKSKQPEQLNLNIGDHPHDKCQVKLFPLNMQN